MPLRQFLGALLYDGVRFERHVRGRWELIRNRAETITEEPDGRGVRCEWRWTSPVDYCRFVPGADVRLLRAALKEWPIELSLVPRPPSPLPSDVTFLIGHRGRARLPHLLLTLRSIAAQRDAAVECLVVEQDSEPRIAEALPPWVRYVFQRCEADAPYRRAATFNESVPLARGRIVVPHDNDMLVPARYAAELVRHADAGFEAQDLKRFIFYLTADDSERVLREGALSLRERSLEVIQNLRGGSVALTKSAYEAIGGFDESFVGWGGEDLELWERAETRRATRFGYLPIVHLWHAPQPEKLQVNEAPAVKRYFELTQVPAAERIARLRSGGR